jgi:hypothetical protein
MRRAVLSVTLITAVVGMAQAGICAQSLMHDRNPLPSMTFLPDGPNALVRPPAPPATSGDKTLQALTAQKLAALNAPPAGIDCKMVREASQGIDPAIRKPGTPPGSPSFSGRVITMPSCAKK